MFGPRQETIDGFESQLATNYLGHFLLTRFVDKFKFELIELSDLKKIYFLALF
jgi:hypothetical protein